LLEDIMRVFLAFILALFAAGPLLGAGDFFFVRISQSGLDKNHFLLEVIRAVYGSKDAPPAPKDDPLAVEIQRAVSDSMDDVDGQLSIDRRLFLVRPGSFALGVSDGVVGNTGDIGGHSCRAHGTLSLSDEEPGLFHLKLSYALVREWTADHPFPGAVITDTKSFESSISLYNGELVMIGGISKTRKDDAKGK